MRAAAIHIHIYMHMYIHIHIFRLGLAKTLNNIDSNNGIQISKNNTILKLKESTVDTHRNKTKHIYIYVYIYIVDYH